jgi:predicted O-methyltransferase YrrM
LHDGRTLRSSLSFLDFEALQKHIFMKYWAGAVGSICRNLARDIRRGRPSKWTFTKQWLCAGYAHDASARAPSAHFLDLYPEAEKLEIDMGRWTFKRSNVTPFEAYCMSCIAALCQPRRIFEFGTFDGGTTLQLARSCSLADVFTLDLDMTSLSGGKESSISTEVENIQAGTVGSRFVGTPEAARIHQLLGNSTTYDYSPYHGTCDMVFVDACHDYEFALSDSRAALTLIRPEGIILWHDYIPGWPGVIKAVDELLPRHAIRHIAGTALAVLDPRF